jgi:hypothetical protein
MIFTLQEGLLTPVRLSGRRSGEVSVKKKLPIALNFLKFMPKPIMIGSAIGLPGIPGGISFPAQDGGGAWQQRRGRFSPAMDTEEPAGSAQERTGDGI